MNDESLTMDMELEDDIPQVVGGDILVLDIETVAEGWEPPVDEPNKFAPIWAWRIVCIGWVLLLTNRKPSDMGSIVGTESEILNSFSKMMEASPRIVTFNGRKFDLPVIQMACLRNKISMPWFFNHLGHRYRYGDKHLDLYDQLSVYGACTPGNMNDIVRSINLPGKTGVDGKCIKELHSQGKIGDIREYCESDVAQTAILYLYFEHLRGELNQERFEDKVNRMEKLWQMV